MFKVSRWRNEKIKVVFRLQFQATQVMNLAGSRLMISVIPADVGQPTVRLRKAVVEDGACTWESPVYETVKFIRETKTGRIQDKVYYFVLATGSSRKGYLGEVSIDFADYLEAFVPHTVSLPINGSNSGAVLHVTLQNMEGDDDQRNMEENGEPNVHSGRTLRSQLSNSRSDGNDEHNSTEGDYYCTTIPQNVETGSRPFFDFIPSDSIRESTLDTSQSSLPEFHIKDRSTRQGNTNLQSPSRQEYTSQGQIPDAAQQVEIDSFLQETVLGHINYSKGATRGPSATSTEQLQQQISALERQAQVTDIELQSLRRQIVKETKKGQDLSRQIISLTEERDALKMESETLKLQQITMNHVEASDDKETRSKSQKRVVEKELIHQKDVNKNLKLQLLKTQDSNSELILVVRDLRERLDKKEKEFSRLSSEVKNCRQDEEFEDKDFQLKLRMDGELVDEEYPTMENRVEEASLVEGKIIKLQGEIEDHVKDKKQLETQLTQLIEDYELEKQENDDLLLKLEQKQIEFIEKERLCSNYMAKIEELEDQNATLEQVIQKQADGHKESSDTILELEIQVKSLHKELEEQFREFEAEIREMTNAKIEQEQKFLQLEEELNMTKSNHATEVLQLQEEFDENEKLIKEAQAEASELRLEIAVLQQHLQNANEDLGLIKCQNETEVQKLSDQLIQKEKEGEQLLKQLEDECTELKSLRQTEEEKRQVLQKENQMLRFEIDRLTEENYHLSKQLEQTKNLSFDMDLMKMSMKEMEKLLEVTSKEKDDLERKYASLRVHAQQSQEELNDTRSAQEKKEAIIESIQSELQEHRAQHNEVKKNLSQIKSDNNDLRKLVNTQKEDLQKKDHVIAHIEEKYKNSSLKEKAKHLKAARSIGMSHENGSKMEEKRHVVRKLQNTEPCASDLSSQTGTGRGPGKSRKENMEKNQKFSSTQINNEGDITQLVSEITFLKEKNRSMEDELREMQEKYSEVSLRFAEVEGERQQLVMTIRNLRNGQKK